MAQSIARHVRTAVTEEHLVRVAHVYLVARGSLPKTSSGKLQVFVTPHLFVAVQVTT